MPLAPDPTATLALPMPETAPPPVVAEPTAAADDAVSPELVLVDPTLRDRLAALPPAPLAPRPSPKPAGPPPETRRPSPPPPSAEPIRVSPTPAEPPPSAPLEHRQRRRWPLVLAAVAGVGLTAAATIILLPQSKSPSSAHVVGPATGHIGTPTSSAPPPAHTATAPPKTTHHTQPSTSPKPPAQTTHPKTTAAHPTTAPATTTPAAPKPKPSTTPSSPPPAAGGKTTHEKLAWAPAAGATAYEMDLLRGSKRVFHARTRQTSLIITVRTGARGPAGSLPPGDYEWIVWPIVGGHKGQPTVRSRLTLPG